MPLSPNTYLLSSVAVGLAQIADAVILVKFKDRGRLGYVTTLFSFAEYGWAAVSFFVWKAAEDAFPLWLPASFIAYTAAFFAAGVALVIQSRGEEVKIPEHIAIAGGVFGLYFSVAAALHVASA
jgi:hypothetical protein